MIKIRIIIMIIITMLVIIIIIRIMIIDACVLIRPPPEVQPRLAVIFAHGNGEDIGITYPFLPVMADSLQAIVVLVEYPGEFG